MDRRAFLGLMSATAVSGILPKTSVDDEVTTSDIFAKSVLNDDDWGLYVNDDSIYVQHGVIPGTKEFEAARKLELRQSNSDDAREDWGIGSDHPYYTDPNYGTDYQDLARSTILLEAEL